MSGVWINFLDQASVAGDFMHMQICLTLRRIVVGGRRNVAQSIDHARLMLMVDDLEILENVKEGQDQRGHPDGPPGRFRLSADLFPRLTLMVRRVDRRANKAYIHTYCTYIHYTEANRSVKQNMSCLECRIVFLK